jgi:hypothetical protein
MMSDEIGREIEWATRIANWKKHNPALFAAYTKRLDCPSSGFSGQLSF